MTDGANKSVIAQKGTIQGLIKCLIMRNVSNDFKMRKRRFNAFLLFRMRFDKRNCAFLRRYAFLRYNAFPMLCCIFLVLLRLSISFFGGI